MKNVEETDNKTGSNNTTSIIIAIIIAMIIGYWIAPSGKTVVNVLPEETTKRITLNDTTWQGVPNLNPKEQVVGHMITKNVWWQVRLDGRDDKVYDLTPMNWEGRQTFILPSSSYTEWRIMPGQSIRQGLLVAERLPLDTYK